MDQKASYIILREPVPKSLLQLGSLVSDISNPFNNCFLDVNIQERDVWVRVSRDFQEMRNDSDGGGVLAKVLSSLLHAEAATDVSYALSAIESRVYKLKNPAMVFGQVCNDPRAREWLQHTRDIGLGAYFITAYRTLIDGRMVFRKGNHQHVGASIPIAEIYGAGVPPDLNIEFGASSSRGTETPFQGQGEEIFAIGYRKIKFRFFHAGGMKASLQSGNKWLKPVSLQMIRDTITGRGGDHSSHSSETPDKVIIEESAPILLPLASSDKNKDENATLPGISPESEHTSTEPTATQDIDATLLPYYNIIVKSPEELDDASETSSTTAVAEAETWTDVSFLTDFGIQNFPGTTRNIVRIFLDNETLKLYYSIATKKLNDSWFEVRYTHILVLFANRLERRANSDLEKLVAVYIKFQSHLIAKLARKAHFIEDITATLQQRLSSVLGASEKVARCLNEIEIERFKKTPFQVGTIQEVPEDIGIEKLEGLNEEELNSITEFLVFGSEFESLCGELQSIVGEESLEMSKNKPSKSIHETGAQGVGISENNFSPFGADVLFIHKGIGPVTFLKVGWLLFGARLRSLFRPAVDPGYRRLEWICECGDIIYGDFDNTNPGALIELETELNNSSYSAEDPSKDAIADLEYKKILQGKGIVSTGDPMNVKSTATEISGAASRDETSIGAVSTSNSRSTGGKWSAPTPASKISSGSLTRNATSLRLQAPSPLPVPVRRFFELCVKHGTDEDSLGEIEVTSLTTDGQLFRSIKERYDALRGERSKLWLLRPKDIYYVRFSLEERYRVNVFEKPKSWPCQAEVDSLEWDCSFPPQMASKTFFHYMSGRKPHFGRRWLSRLPKKRNRPLHEEPVELPMGWGIQIIEGLNEAAAAWFFFLAICAIVTITVVWSIVRKDLSTGIGLGQLLTGVAALIVTYLIASFYQQMEGVI